MSSVNALSKSSETVLIDCNLNNLTEKSLVGGCVCVRASARACLCVGRLCVRESVFGVVLRLNFIEDFYQRLLLSNIIYSYLNLLLK